MSLKELENLVSTDVLKHEAPDQREIDGLVRSGRSSLTDASRADLSAESRFSLAYNAAHRFALAGMRWHGYRPNNVRYAVFQSTVHTLGLDKATMQILNKSHAFRNSIEYDGSSETDEQLTKELIDAAKKAESALAKLGPVKNKK